MLPLLAKAIELTSLSDRPSALLSSTNASPSVPADSSAPKVKTIDGDADIKVPAGAEMPRIIGWFRWIQDSRSSKIRPDETNDAQWWLPATIHQTHEDMENSPLSKIVFWMACLGTFLSSHGFSTSSLFWCRSFNTVGDSHHFPSEGRHNSDPWNVWVFVWKMSGFTEGFKSKLGSFSLARDSARDETTHPGPRCAQVGKASGPKASCKMPGDEWRILNK